MKKRYLIFDVETTTKNKGNAFTEDNRICYAVVKPLKQEATVLDFLATPEDIEILESYVSKADVLVGFNLKFDLHWLRVCDIDFSHCEVWDCQYAEFLFSNQLKKYPSLNWALEKHGLGAKQDKVVEYWEKGVDTPDIPKDVMLEYTRIDGEQTERLFLKQLELFSTTEKSKYQLFKLHCEDLLVLQDMEYNGIPYDTQKSLSLNDIGVARMEEIKEILLKDYHGLPINLSGDGLSYYLYGGVLTVDTRVPVGVYKTGAKQGQTRYKIVSHSYELPRIFEPLKGSELKKEGLYATNESTLKQLRPAKDCPIGATEAKSRLCLLDELSKLEKLCGTYYGGFPKKIAEMAWANDTLHPSFNQCSVVTGRLSSIGPNCQNLNLETKQLCPSRY